MVPSVYNQNNTKKRFRTQYFPLLAPSFRESARRVHKTYFRFYFHSKNKITRRIFITLVPIIVRYCFPIKFVEKVFFPVRLLTSEICTLPFFLRQTIRCYSFSWFAFVKRRNIMCSANIAFSTP